MPTAGPGPEIGAGLEIEAGPGPGAWVGAETRQADPAESEQHLRGVVDVGAALVVEPDRPAARGRAGPAHLPVPGPGDLLSQQPGGGPGQGGLIGREAGVGARVERPR